MTLEDRLNLWLQQPGAFVTPAERQFIADMREAAASRRRKIDEGPYRQI